MYESIEIIPEENSSKEYLWQSKLCSQKHRETVANALLLHLHWRIVRTIALAGNVVRIWRVVVAVVVVVLSDGSNWSRSS